LADVEVYARDAARFFELYESLTFERAHRAVRDELPERFGTVLDVGAGSGRDAAWFAARGADVFAVEPAGALRDLAVARHRSPRIHWVDDALPALPRIRSAGSRFDLIWLSAVWMHVPTGQRSRAFRVLADLLAPGGRLFVSLRHGAFGDGRTAHPVAAEELLRLGREHGLVCVHHAAGEAGAADALGRVDVRWESLILAGP
jgi:SAM-dependent methyltransferase